MLKIKSILVSLLAIAALASCSNDLDDDSDGGVTKGYDVAYVSISLTNPKTSGTRASGEQPSLPEESAIKELYVITFNASKVVVKDADALKYATVLGTTEFGTNAGITTPNTPVKVSTDTQYLLVVANPGTVLQARLDNIANGATFNDINALITVTTKSGEANNSYLVDEVVHANGCAMINAGFYDDSDLDPNNHAWKADCLLDVSGNIFKASDYKTEQEALNAAKSKPAQLDIERLASKLEVMLNVLEIGPFEEGTGNSLGQFEFGNWTIDYYNSLLFPFAQKTKTRSSHTTGFYKSNFYTVDPNFTKNSGTEYLTGIIKNVLDASREPKVDWVSESSIAGENYRYCIENTMAKDYQKFGAATRLVIKGKYAPWKDDADFTLGDDWYRLSNGTNSINFKNFTKLKDAYTPAAAKNEDARTALEKLLVNACDKFYTQVKTALGSNDPGSFAALTQDILDNISANGGELTKEDGCIYWYQNSLNYYYYEIRHDNAANDHMEYGKYGVVRNNYYTLTLTKVNGNGTPWYPGDGPEDPEEEEDIDKLGAYLHFEIKVAPWVYWQTNFEI
ncbi:MULTISPECIES: Mfa1 family fimbria major subunit [Bacteroides]|uniref:Mfa1 family fimbria major subunit n=1 Tax=Bacteroides TaxID=816 RepID=UPI000A733E71|nr:MULTISPECIES: Mfa1 family fimbria major subunit [Bacteroides]RHE83298.1 hypothetical protein DW715_04990 [Bacteroides intestinalis]